MAGARFACFLLSVGLAIPCLGGETIYLTNGFRLEAVSHTMQGDTIIVRTGTGTLEFPKKLVNRIAAAAATHPRVEAPLARETTGELLRQAANGEGLEPELVESVAKIESGLHQSAVSAKGAVGLMQLMPGTAVELGATAADAPSNALGGAKYLRELLVRYHGNYALALAAYNAGPGAVARYHGVPPYAETVHYVRNVLREYNRQKLRAGLKAELQALKTDGPRPINRPSATN